MTGIKTETVGNFGFWILKENSNTPDLIPTDLVWEFLLYGVSARQREWFNFGQIYHPRHLSSGTTFTGNIWLEDFRKMQYFQDLVGSPTKQELLAAYLGESGNTTMTETLQRGQFSKKIGEWVKKIRKGV